MQKANSTEERCSMTAAQKRKMPLYLTTEPTMNSKRKSQRQGTTRNQAMSNLEQYTLKFTR
jgi:hypothetical protein